MNRKDNIELFKNTSNMPRIISKNPEDIQVKKDDKTISLKEVDFQTRKSGALPDTRGEFKGWSGEIDEAASIYNYLECESFDININQEVQTQYGTVIGFERCIVTRHSSESAWVSFTGKPKYKK